MRTLYLDYNATTPIAPTVQEAMHPFLAEHYGNPSSHHALGRACQEAMEDARGQIASLIGADADELIFTSGGTESNNMALKGVALGPVGNKKGHLVISAFEHPAIVEPARYLERIGFRISTVPCTAEGIIDPESVADAIESDTVLVSIMHANNEIGTIQPIREIAGVCHERNVLVHTDAAQSVGKIAAKVDELDVDLMSIAGHKLYAPKGIGALYVRQGVALEPVLHGAGHEEGMRAGTENVPYIVGLGRAAAMAQRGLDELADRMETLRDRLEASLMDRITKKLVRNGAIWSCLPNTLSMSFPNVSGHKLLSRIPELCASTGAACHSGPGTISTTLSAIGVSAEQAQGTVRLSVGWFTSEEEVDRAAECLVGAWESLQ